MRMTNTFPLACSVALLAACAAEAPRSLPGETASSGAAAGAPTNAPSRDLTLQLPAAPALEVASPVELSRSDPKPTPIPRPRVSPRPAPAPAPAAKPVAEVSPVASAVVPIPSLPVTEVGAQPVEEESAAAGSARELAPGKTVTVIPASAGSSTPLEAEDSWSGPQPARGILVGGGGGRCRPRGGVRGIGIAGRIPFGRPGLRLR
jgi:hypothetical protein